MRIIEIIQEKFLMAFGRYYNAILINALSNLIIIPNRLVSTNFGYEYLLLNSKDEDAWGTGHSIFANPKFVAIAKTELLF